MRLFRLALLMLVAPVALAAQGAPAERPAPATAADTVQARLRAARSDLRNLVVAQEAYFADHARYGATLEDVKFTPTRGFTIRFLVVEPNSWSAELRHPRLRGSCVMFVNLDEPRRPKTVEDALVPKEGEPLCDGQPELPAQAAPPATRRP